ncbi:MAG TPA: transglycosylase domain-containing protein [Herpetosiphonaceae bacterium]
MRAPLTDRTDRSSPLGLLGLALLRLCEAILLGALIAAVIGLSVYRYYSRGLPDPSQLATHRPFETTRIYARDGQTLLYEVFDAGQRTVVPLDQVPWAVKAATIAVEDADFFDNPGVDLRGIVRALWLNRQGTIMSGGSTITQQVARNVLLPPEERAEQSYDRKIREAILAFHLSRQYSKEQVLSFYLNEVYYGNMAYGIEAAAQSYFGKPARELDLPEATLLAGLVQSPSELNPLNAPDAAKARQRIVLDLMVKQGRISRQQADAAYAAPLTLRPSTVDIRAPHWVFYVLDQLEQQYGADLLRRGGLRVITTLDPAIQSLTEEVARARMAELQARDAHNAAVVVIDPKTSEIVAMVGSVDYNNAAIDGQVNVTLAPRQPGSALKPIVYAGAMMQPNGWTPATVIWDTPLNVNGYQPMNYDNRFHGPQRLRQALANSFNIPAVKALQFIGVDAFLDLAHSMGITTLQERERYGLAVALGAGEVKLLDLATAYTTFANAGRARPAVSILRVATNHGEVLYSYKPPTGTQVLGPYGDAIAYLITSILSDNDARTPMFGPNSVMRLKDDRPAAVKTGTSNDFKDSWAVGYTPDLVVGVWVGNTDNTPMQEVAGSNGAGTIWREIMERTHEGKPPEQFERPPNVKEAQICRSTGVIANGCADAITELFVDGAQPKPQPGQYITVTVGGDGSCLATDFTPQSERRQKTFLVAPPEARGWRGEQPPTQPCAAPSAAGTQTPASPDVVAAIESPAAGMTVGSTISIKGSAAGAYTLFYGAGAQPTSWTTIASGPGGVAHGLLGMWNTDALPSGIYTLQLEVVLPGNPPQTARSTVRIDHEQMTVRLIQPAPDTTIAPGTTVQLMVEASGPVTRVEFIVDGQMIGSTAHTAASWNWRATGRGRHTLEAAVYNADGKRVVSPPVVVLVQ